MMTVLSAPSRDFPSVSKLSLEQYLGPQGTCCAVWYLSQLPLWNDLLFSQLKLDWLYYSPGTPGKAVCGDFHSLFWILFSRYWSGFPLISLRYGTTAQNKNKIKNKKPQNFPIFRFSGHISFFSVLGCMHYYSLLFSVT